MNTRLSTGFSVGALAAAALGVLAFSAQGCTVTLVDTTDGGDPFDTGAPDAAKDTAADAPPVNQCNECLFQQCSGQWAVCQQTAECLAIYQCATKPNCDQNCVNACFAGHPAGQQEYTALYTCDQVGSCGTCKTQCNTQSSSCPTPDAGTDSGTPDAGPLSCTDCSAQKCAAEKTACGSGSDCDGYSQCLAVCQDIPCVEACGLAHADGKKASEALGTCTVNQCKSECGL
jgi:hypothetical protein